MKAVKKVSGDNLVIEVEGRVDTTTAPELEAIIKGEVGSWKKLIIDCAKLDYISSAGLRVLLAAYKSIGALDVINANDTIKEVFDITGLSILSSNGKSLTTEFHISRY